MDLWAGFNQPNFGPALATEQPGFATAGEPFSYGSHGFIATDVHLHTDQIGTQLDPPAHWNEYGATISDVPASVSLRPLVVIDVTAQVAADPTYFATVADVEAHEAAHGRIPAGSAVFFRSDWSRGWEGYDGSETMPSVGLDALKLLHLERGVLVHGHEPLDTSTTPNMAEEAWLMHANFLQIEGATNLHLLPPTGCLLSIGFAKILGGAGGYARLIAVCPEDWAHGVTVATHPGAPLPTQSAPLRAPSRNLRPTRAPRPPRLLPGMAAGCCGLSRVYSTRYVLDPSRPSYLECPNFTLAGECASTPARILKKIGEYHFGGITLLSSADPSALRTTGRTRIGAKTRYKAGDGTAPGAHQPHRRRHVQPAAYIAAIDGNISGWRASASCASFIAK